MVAADPRPVTRVALLSSEPIRPAMGGIGIRYLELARRLPAFGLDVVLLSPAAPEESARCGLDPARVRRATAATLAEATADRDVAVGQGQLVNDLIGARPELPLAVDLYDPWLVENLHYFDELGLEPYRNDHATWVLQLGHGDFFPSLRSPSACRTSCRRTVPGCRRACPASAACCSAVSTTGTTTSRRSTRSSGSRAARGST